MSNKSYNVIDVFDYVNEEENVKEYGKRLYIDIQRLASDIEHGLKNNRNYKDHMVDMSNEYKKYLADMLYQDALRMNRSELQEVSFYSEETTNDWTLEKLQIQFVKDQIEFYEGGNLDQQVDETWQKVEGGDM